MQAAERDRDAFAVPTDASTEEGPALRDASAAAERAAVDEREAEEAREGFARAPMSALEPDDEILPHLLPAEHVHALRRRAIVREPGGDRALGYGGTLYLTSERLIHLGQVVMTLRLTDVTETSLAGERLLLTLRNGEGIAVDVDRPRLLRAQIAEAERRLKS